MLRGVWANLVTKAWGPLFSVSRLGGPNTLRILSKGIPLATFLRTPSSHLHIAYWNYFNSAKFFSWRVAPILTNANTHRPRFHFNNSTNIQWINKKNIETSFSKFNISKLVSHGYYSGLWKQWLHVAKDPLFKLETTNIVRQLLDSLHKISNSSYRREYIKLQSLNNNEQELAGSFIEFEIPNLNRNHLYIQESNLLDENTLLEMESTIASMKKLHENTTKIFRSYGYLPTEKTDEGKLQIHFPNKTALETERLISDLGIIEGMIHNQSTMGISKYNRSQESADDILSSSSSTSSFGSTENDMIYLNSFSPVLSQFSL